MPCESRLFYLACLLCLHQALGLLYAEPEADDQELDLAGKRAVRNPSCQRCYSNPSDWLRCISCYNSYANVPYRGMGKRTIFPEEEKRGFIDDDRDWSKRGYFDDDRDWAKRGYFDADRDWAKRGYFDDDRDWAKRSYFDADRDWAKRGYFDADRDWSKRSFFDSNREWSKRSGDEEMLEDSVDKRSRFMDCKCCLITGKPSCCKGCNYVPYNGYKYQKRVYAPRMQSNYYGNYCACCQRGSFDFGCCLSCALK